MSTEDLGCVGSWKEAFEVAQPLLVRKDVKFIATVSLQEFLSGGYVGVGDVGGIPIVTMIRFLEEMAPKLYPGNVTFHLFKKEMETVDGLMNMFVIVCLKPGEVCAQPVV